MVRFGEFLKPEACGQTVLPDRSISIGQKLVENAKIEKFKWDILGDFQTMWDFSSKIQDDHHGGFELGHAPLKHFQNDKRAQIELKKQLN